MSTVGYTADAGNEDLVSTALGPCLRITVSLGEMETPSLKGQRYLCQQND